MCSYDWNCDKIEELVREPSVREEHERLLHEGNDDNKIINFYASRYTMQAQHAIYMVRTLNGWKSCTENPAAGA